MGGLRRPSPFALTSSPASLFSWLEPFDYAAGPVSGNGGWFLDGFPDFTVLAPSDIIASDPSGSAIFNDTAITGWTSDAPFEVTLQFRLVIGDDQGGQISFELDNAGFTTNTSISIFWNPGDLAANKLAQVLAGFNTVGGAFEIDDLPFSPTAVSTFTIRWHGGILSLLFNGSLLFSNPTAAPANVNAHAQILVATFGTDVCHVIGISVRNT